MASKKEVLEVLKKQRGEWQAFLSNLDAPELSDVARIVGELQREFETAAKAVGDARLCLDSEIDKRRLAEDRRKRKQTRAKPRVTLREFLQEPQTEKDVPLKQLVLCTKSGATVALVGLTFKIGTEGRRIETANEAKRLFQEGMVLADPLWDLYYARDGERSAGFGWDRPFLDIVYVLPETSQ